MTERKPKIGIGVMVLKDKKILLGKRKNSLGAGAYAVPGGHLEFNESFEECAVREVKEETGMEIENIQFLCVANLRQYDDHYVGLGMLADWEKGDPEIKEPDKCEGWEWYDLNALPAGDQFGIFPIAVKAYQTGQKYFDINE